MNMVQNLSTELSEPHLDRLIEAINQLGGSRVLLTGGTGFVALALHEIISAYTFVNINKLK